MGLFLQSCLFQEDDLFADSSANRTTESVDELKSLLTSVPNGWRMEYYIGKNYSGGGINILCRFDGKNATLMSEVGGKNVQPGVEASSLYKVTSEESTLLTFDSFNELIHCYSEPILNQNMNLEGDYEFVYRGQEDSKIILEGRLYHNTIVLTPMEEGVEWADYINRLKSVENKAAFTNYALTVGAQEAGRVQKHSRVLVFSTDEGEQIQTPFIYTDDGLKLQAATDLNGKMVQHFVWNNEAQAYACTDDGATDVTLKGLLPDGYIPYQDYLGSYLMGCYKYDSNSQSFKQQVTAVEIKENVQGQSYILTGTTLKQEAGDIVLTYDGSTGRILFKQQAMALGRFPDYYGSLVMSCQYGFLLAYQGLDFGNISDYVGAEMGLIGNVNTTQSGKMLLTFTEYGTFFSSTAGKPATGICIGAYSSEAFTEANYLGYVVWYDTIMLQKN